MWTNGSRSRIPTPAKARVTGKPSPSNPLGPVVTDRTGRSVSPSVAGFRRGNVKVSAVTAGISASKMLHLQRHGGVTPGRAGEFPRRTSQHCAGTAAVQNSTRSQVDRSGLFDPAQPDGSQRRDPQGYGRGLAVPRLVAGIDA